MALKPGSRLTLNAGRGAAIRLRCGGTTLFEGRAGRRRGQIAVRIERELITSSPQGPSDPPGGEA